MTTPMVRTVVCVYLWISVWQVSGSYIPQEMNRTIQNLLHYYKSSPNEIFNGKSIFPREPLNGKPETKMVFLGGVLGAYEMLIEHMLKQLPTPSPQIAGSKEKPASSIPSTSGTAGKTESVPAEDVRPKLLYILTKIQNLKTHHYQEQERVLNGLQALKTIQMDNIKVQKKALWELPWLLEEASSVANDIKLKRRRRRQARTKTHLRG